ncbi:MAG TPA: hypothetical protein VH309_08725 [Elusimicrobiota bacterium]|nr:hypothetical protein [Elusimicrobiota bacterium]
MTRFPPKKILVPFDPTGLSEAAWARDGLPTPCRAATRGARTRESNA